MSFLRRLHKVISFLESKVEPMVEEVILHFSPLAAQILHKVAAAKASPDKSESSTDEVVSQLRKMSVHRTPQVIHSPRADFKIRSPHYDLSSSTYSVGSHDLTYKDGPTVHFPRQRLPVVKKP